MSDRYVDCKECGVHEHLHWMKDMEEKLIANSLCFECNFWQEHIALANDPKSCRVKHCHYRIGKPTAVPSRHNGFGGDIFNIKFFDGRTDTTNNMWSQGAIPERFWDRLPDNAEFVPAHIEEAV